MAKNTPGFVKRKCIFCKDAQETICLRCRPLVYPGSERDNLHTIRKIPWLNRLGKPYRTEAEARRAIFADGLPQNVSSKSRWETESRKPDKRPVLDLRSARRRDQVGNPAKVPPLSVAPKKGEAARVSLFRRPNALQQGAAEAEPAIPRDCWASAAMAA